MLAPRKPCQGSHVLFLAWIEGVCCLEISQSEGLVSIVSTGIFCKQLLKPCNNPAWKSLAVVGECILWGGRDKLLVQGCCVNG